MVKLLEGDHCGHYVISPEDVPMPFAELAPDGRVLSCNAALLELTGYEGVQPDKLPPMIDLVPDGWRPGSAKVAPGPETLHFSASLPAKDGTLVPAEVFVRRVNDDSGLPCRFMAGIIDMPTLWSLETGLIQAEQTSSMAFSVLDTIGAPVIAVDAGSRIVYANEYSRRLFGKPPHDVIGADLWDAYPVSHHDLLYRMYRRAIDERVHLSCDHFSPRLNQWFETHFYPREDGSLVITMDNVTARKQYERFMGFAAYAIGRINDYLLWLDRKGFIAKANSIVYKRLLITENRKSRFQISEVSAIKAEQWAEIWGEITQKGSTSLDTELIGRDGKAIPVQASVSFVYYHGQEYGVIIARDITDRIAADREITRSRQQAELYLDLMSHDINNMNQIGIGFLEMVMNSPELSEETRELLKKPLEAFNRSSELISSVKKLQKASGALTMAEIDLAGMLREVTANYANVQERDVSIQLHVTEGCRVMANPLLKEVFTNLVDNAIKHSRDRLDIRITLERAVVADRPCCVVAIEDTGPGVPVYLKSKLFSPKALAGKGGRHRGLGLILVKTLLDDFGGTIDVEDRVPGDPGKGVRFIVTLPAA